MSLVEITGTTGIGPYNIYVCDPTLSYCELITGTTTIPPTVYYIPSGMFISVPSLVIKIVDTSSGCETFKLFQCPSPTPTPTQTPTPTLTPSNCLCIRIDNPTGSVKSFTYLNCEDILVFESCAPLTSLFVCGKFPSGDVSLIISELSPCIEGGCPEIYLTPTPTPSISLTPTNTPTPTQTLPQFNKIFQTGDNFILMSGDYYIFELQ